jgi:hypothetical protein
MKKWIAIMLFSVSVLVACNKSMVPERVAEVKTIVNDQQYTFVAETAHPLGSSSIRLSQGFDLRITSTSVAAYLPFYGRAYAAPIDPNQGGIKFTSSRFQYTKAANNDGGWDITIRPEDVSNIQEMQLSISAEGAARLYVTSTNRQAISFTGQVMTTPAK